MLRRLLGVAAALALPALLVAQTPNTQASATAKEKTTLAHGKAKHRRGDVVHKEDTDRDRDDRTKGEDKDRDRDDGTKTRNPKAATPAVPVHGEGPATPATPAHKAGTGGRKP